MAANLLLAASKNVFLEYSGQERKRWIPVVAVAAGSSYFLFKWATSFARRRQLAQKVAECQLKRDEAFAALRESLLINGELMTSRREEIVNLPFDELHAFLQNGEIKVMEVLQAFEAKALIVQELSNAVTGFLENEAILQAAKLDQLPKEKRGPLHGIPISLKEHIHVKGKDATVGIPSNLGKLCPEDAGIILALRELGAVPFCRTNLPQTCFSFDCSNPIYGITVNPRNPSRSPGGSSGGEGALIAGGGSILGIGSDLGGSVRIPAMFCGITSFKPTAGRLTITGQGSDGGLVGVVGLYNTLGLMGRSAKIIDVCFKNMVNLENLQRLTCDPRLVKLPYQPVEKKHFKIGWYDFDGCNEVTPGVKRALMHAKSVLEQQGHELIKVDLGELHQKVMMLYGVFATADGWKGTLDLLKDGKVDSLSLGMLERIWALPNWLTKMIGPLIMKFLSPSIGGFMLEGFNTPYSWQLWEKQAERLALVRQVLKLWNDYGIDAMIAPGFNMPCQKLGFPAYQLGAINYTAVYNLLNFPAGSVPVSVETRVDQENLAAFPLVNQDGPLNKWIKEGTLGAEGMGLNVQVIARPWCEETVLKVMLELEDSVNPDLPNHL